MTEPVPPRSPPQGAGPPWERPGGGPVPARPTRALRIALPSAPFERWRVAVCDERDAARVQAFYDANPAYFSSVSGKPALPTDGLDDLRQQPPADWPWTGRWYVGFFDAEDHLAAVADITSDLLAPGVWHLGLLIVETARHGRGDAHAVYRALEDWARANGAAWMRLGVVQGNVRAEAFWARQGYVQTRLREGIAFGELTRTVCVMVKLLGNLGVASSEGDSIEQYLTIVPRDRPESP
jgi:GNAT superfamily N-acetyltransferase